MSWNVNLKNKMNSIINDTRISDNFKLSLRMVVQDSEENVCFKRDGQRFEREDTVKLNANTEYVLYFTIRPTHCLVKLFIDGKAYNLEMVKGVENEEEIVYRTLYSLSRLDISNSGARRNISFLLQFRQGLYMTFGVQCKVYESGETSHANWGQKLSAIDMDCKLDEEHNCFTIDKEKYL